MALRFLLLKEIFIVRHIQLFSREDHSEIYSNILNKSLDSPYRMEDHFVVKSKIPNKSLNNGSFSELFITK